MRGWLLVGIVSAALVGVCAIGWLLRRPGVNRLWGLAFWCVIALGLVALVSAFR